MPLARIDLATGKPDAYRRAIGDVVYEAIVAALGAPEGDRFQIVTEHPAAELTFDRSYLGVHRTDDCVFIQLTLNAGRSLEQKRAFYSRVADGLHERLGLARGDVFISLVEVARENWSFGDGVAQYAP